MTPDRWRRIEELFEAAQALDPADGEEYLRAQCGGDQALHQEVASLLQHHRSDAALVPGATAVAGLLRKLTAPGTLRPDAHFGPYVIDRFIGAGGMGEVYLARDTRLHRPVALKLLAEWISDDEELVKRFAQEALAVSALTHPNIPVVYEAGEISGRHYIAGEFVDGESLSRRVARGIVPWQEAVAIALQIAHALEAAHGAGILHRDVKPGNVLLCADGRAKLVDFGIAKPLAGAVSDSRAGGPRTRTGLVVGTPGYMAPEQAAGKPVDVRSDIWSLAAVTQEMLTGHAPALGLSRILAAPNMPAALAQVLERALQADPNRRYQSAAEFAAALQALLEPRLFKVDRRAWFSAGAVLGAAMLAGAIFWHQKGESARVNARRVIAVLPFDNMSGDAGNDYFAQGIQDEVLTHLAKISKLKVMSRHAAAAFGSRPDSLQAVGAKLRVGTVLEGSVQKQGERVRINVQLIDTESATDLWGESYDRDAVDVFDVERDIAENVAQKLQSIILPREQAAVSAVETRDAQAHVQDLQCRFYKAKPDERSLQIAIDYCRQAIARDPRYAMAYADLAAAYFKLSNAMTGSEPEVRAVQIRSRSAAERAITLAPNLADGHMVLGWVFLYIDWDLVAARREFSLAANLAPNSPSTRSGLATLDAIFGDFDAAIATIKDARSVDPLSSVYATNLANFLLAKGDYAAAEAMYRLSLQLDPQASMCHGNLAQIAAIRGAFAAADQEAQLEPDRDYGDFARALAGQKPGNPQARDASLQQFIRQHAQDAPFLVASLYAFRGDADDAFLWLERAYAARDVGTIELLESPFFGGLSADPRFAAFAGKLGLPTPGQRPLRS